MKTKTENRKTMLTRVNQWWNQTDFKEMSLITGFRQYEFNPEDGYQAFVDACDNYWNKLNSDERINAWKKYN